MNLRFARQLRGAAFDEPKALSKEAPYGRTSIERRLSREAALAQREPSPALRRRTLRAIYDLEFHRRYRRQSWWRTPQGGSALVAASVLIAGILFGLMTLDAPAPRAARVADRAGQTAAGDSSPIFATLHVNDEGAATFDLVDDSMELAALAAPEWVLRAISPPSIRNELSAMADGALRAADYLFSQFAAGLGEKTPGDSGGGSRGLSGHRLDR
jgi:hypothetical protein